MRSCARRTRTSVTVSAGSSTDGSRAVIGAKNEAGPSNRTIRGGAAYVFERTNGRREETAVLRAPERGRRWGRFRARPPSPTRRQGHHRCTSSPTRSFRTRPTRRRTASSRWTKGEKGYLSKSIAVKVEAQMELLVQLQTIFWGKQFAIAPSSSLRYGRTRSVQSSIAQRTS